MIKKTPKSPMVEWAELRVLDSVLESALEFDKPWQTIFAALGQHPAARAASAHEPGWTTIYPDEPGSATT